MSEHLTPLTQLPGGDLWRPPVINEDGSHVPRPDTVDLSHLPPMRGNMSADQTAILMAELQRAESALAAKK